MMSDMPVVIEVRSLSVSYGAIRAAQDVSLRIPVGVTALVGANGAGKSSLVNAIAGHVAVSGGDVLLDGNSIRTLPSHRRTRRHGLVLVPEGRGVVADMTTRENLDFGLSVGRWRRRHGLAYPSELSELDGLLALFPALKPRLAMPARLLSGGEQQMLSLARALASEPRVLLIDEPSLGLSPTMVADIFAALRSVTERLGLAVLLIEQDTRTALAVSSRAYVMDRGCVVMEGTAADVADSELLKTAYLGAREEATS